MGKQYYWLKLHEDFFDDKRIKKLRKLAGGDTFTIIYLKMQLLSMTTDGYLYFDKVFDTFSEELAEQIGEEVDNVKITLQYLESVGLLVSNEEGTDFLLTDMENNIGSETASAKRTRECRARKKEIQALQCNTDVTEEKRNLLQCNTDVTNEKRACSVEKEIEIDKEKRKINKREKASAFEPPTIEQVEDYCVESDIHIDPAAFVNYYQSKGWAVGKTKMTDWKASVRYWESIAKQRGQPVQNKVASFAVPNSIYTKENIAELEAQLLDN